MDTTQRTYKGQVEINDLIDEAVKNSVARRNQAMDSENALLTLSSEEAGNVAGGQIILIKPLETGIIGTDYPIA